MPEYDELVEAMRKVLAILGSISTDEPDDWARVDAEIQAAHDILDEILGDVKRSES